jgi:hypothetical protein
MDKDNQKKNEFTSRSEIGMIGFDNIQMSNTNNIHDKNINNDSGQENKVINLGSPEMARDRESQKNKITKNENNYNKINNFSGIDNLSKFGGPGESPSIILLNQNDNLTDNNISNLNIPIPSNNHPNRRKSSVNYTNNHHQNFINQNFNNNNLNNENSNNKNFHNRPSINMKETKINNLEKHNNPHQDRKGKIVETKNSKIQCCFNIFHIFLFILTIICFQVNYYSVSGFTLAEGVYFESIVSSWFSSPITDVTLRCNTNHTTFIEDSWEGTVGGCQCGELLYRGRCTRNSMGSKIFCSNIPQIKPIKYDIWKKAQICTERIPGGYFDMIIASNPSECPTDTRSCGIIDTLNNYLCYNKSLRCPYNKITNDLNQYILKSDKKFDYYDSSNLIFGRDDTDKKILFSFKVGFNLPCLNPYFKNLNFTVNTLNYYFEKQYCFPFSDGLVKNTVVYDKNYIIIDNYQGEKLYNENGIEQKLATLPNYSKQEYQRNINLYATNYFGLKIKCFNKIKNEKKVDKLFLDLRNFIAMDNFNASLITGIFIEFLLVITIVIMICYLNRSIRSIGRIQPSDMNCYTYIFIFDFLLLFIYFLIAISYVVKMNVSDDIKYIFGNEECTDNYTSTIFLHFIELMDKSRKAAIGMSFLIIFQLSLWSGFVIYSYRSLNKIDFYEI